MKYFLLHSILLMNLFCWPSVAAEETKAVLKVYGTEGPFPAIREAAEAFTLANNIKIEITSNPVEKWKQNAVKDADIIYSSAETVMNDYITQLGIIDAGSFTNLYLRPAALIVRSGNPKKIKGLKDFTHRDLKIIIVDGQGQISLWEDMVGRLKDIEAVSDFRKRISFTGKNVDEAIKFWDNHEEVDAWLAFVTWGKSDAIKGDAVKIEKDLVVYRGLGAAVTTITNQRELSLKFIEYLKSTEAEKIFKNHGWFKKEK